MIARDRKLLKIVRRKLNEQDFHSSFWFEDYYFDATIDVGCKTVSQKHFKISYVLQSVKKVFFHKIIHNRMNIPEKEMDPEK